MLALSLLGTLSLQDDAASVPSAARQKRPLGLLAVLALGGRQSMSRQRIEAYLWPESSSGRARHALDQAVYALRRSLGGDIILSTAQELTLNPSMIRVDVWEFEDALRQEQWDKTVDIYRGPLLEGFQVGDSRELEAWIDTERARLLRAYQSALAVLAARAVEVGNHSLAVTWSRALARSDPLSASAIRKLMLALEADGDRAGAVKEGRQYQDLVRRELEMEPDSEIEAIATRLSRSPARVATGDVPSRSRAATPVELERTGIAAPPPESRPVATLGRSYWLVALTVIAALVIGAVAVRNGQARSSTTRTPGQADPVGELLPSAAARDEFLRGLNALGDRTSAGHDSAIVYFRRATQLHPGYAEAYAQLAETYVRIGYFGYRPADAVFPKAKAAALRGIEMDSTLASAYTALATVLIWEHDFPAAEAQFQRAISLDSSNATAHQWYGVLLMILRRVAESVAAEKRAAALEPLSLQIQNNYAMFLSVSGDHVGALRHYQRTVTEEPDTAWVGRNPWLLANMARVYAYNGRYSDALRLIDRALVIVPRSPRALHSLAAIHTAMGRPGLALQAFERADTANDQYAAYRGMVHAAQGNADSAFFWFDRQLEWGIQPMLTLQADRQLDRWRKDARFLALLTRLRIPH